MEICIISTIYNHKLTTVLLLQPLQSLFTCIGLGKIACRKLKHTCDVVKVTRNRRSVGRVHPEAMTLLARLPKLVNVLCADQGFSSIFCQCLGESVQGRNVYPTPPILYI